MFEHKRREAEERLELSTRSVHGRVVIAVAGEIDLVTAGQLRRALLEAARAGERQVVVDLTGVRYMDSTGLGALVAARRRLRAGGGSLQLVVPHDSLLKLFAITHLDWAFAIHRSLDGALGAPDAEE